jgi:hypothetical protein
MATTIGRVDFIVGLDGTTVPTQGRVIGEKIAQAISGAMRKRLGTELGKLNLDKEGTALGNRFADRFFQGLRGNIARQISSVQNELGSRFRSLGGQLSLPASAFNDLGELRQVVDDLGDSARNANDGFVLIRREITASGNDADTSSRKWSRLRGALSDARVGMMRLGDSIGGVHARLQAAGDDGGESLWRRLSANTRQWTLIIAAIATGGEDIAALGSAAGAGLIALGAALSSAVVGVGVGIAAFVKLNKEISTLPASLRPAAAAFQGLKGPLSDLQTFLSVQALAGTADAWKSLGNTIRALQPSLTPISKVIGGIVNDLAKNLKPGTDQFAILTGNLATAAPIFDSLVRSVGTFAEAFGRSFIRATPIVAGLVAWISRLANQFNAFTQGNGFDEWMDHAQSVFSHLGPLLNSAGRLLNNLVTDESVGRLDGFLDSLTSFMPNLQRLLNMLGNLDLFGFLAETLDQIGTALRPLAGPATELAAALRRLASITLGALAGDLQEVASALAPVVRGLADFINAVPPGAIEALTQAVVLFFAAWGGYKVITLAAGAIAGVQAGLALLGRNLTITGRAAQVFGGTVTAGLGKAATAAGGFATKMSTVTSLLRGAAAIGIIAIGVKFIGDQQIADLTTKLKQATSAAQTMKVALDSRGGNISIKDATASVKGLGKALDGINKTQNLWEFLNGPAGTARPLLAVQQLNSSLTQLAQTSLPAAQQQFKQLSDAANLNDKQQRTLLKSMGDFKSTLVDQATDLGISTSMQNLLALATGDTSLATDSARAKIEAMGGATDGANDSAKNLSATLRDLGNSQLSVNGAARDYNQALSDATQSIKDNAAALADHKNKLDLTTQAGRDNQAALDQLAQSTSNYAAQVFDATQDQGQANAIISAGRDQLIKMLGQLGITGKAAQDYADKLGLIPQKITTVIYANTDSATGTIDRLYRTWNGKTIHMYVTAQGVGHVPGTGANFMASGGVLTGPRNIVAGEAGPEAIVPLNRPLSQVDPSVRALSAIAQGLSSTPHLASGGVALPGGGQTTIMPGAFQINTRDPYRAAIEVLDGIAEGVNS